MFVMFLGVPAMDAYVVVYCKFSLEAISDVIHVHLEYILEHFQAKWHEKEMMVPPLGVECS